MAVLQKIAEVYQVTGDAEHDPSLPQGLQDIQINTGTNAWLPALTVGGTSMIPGALAGYGAATAGTMTTDLIGRGWEGLTNSQRNDALKEGQDLFRRFDSIGKIDKIKAGMNPKYNNYAHTLQENVLRGNVKLRQGFKALAKRKDLLRGRGAKGLLGGAALGAGVYLGGKLLKDSSADAYYLGHLARNAEMQKEAVGLMTLLNPANILGGTAGLVTKMGERGITKPIRNFFKNRRIQTTAGDHLQDQINAGIKGQGHGPGALFQKARNFVDDAASRVSGAPTRASIMEDMGTAANRLDDQLRAQQMAMPGAWADNAVAPLGVIGGSGLTYGGLSLADKMWGND